MFLLLSKQIPKLYVYAFISVDLFAPIIPCYLNAISAGPLTVAGKVRQAPHKVPQSCGALGVQHVLVDRSTGNAPQLKAVNQRAHAQGDDVGARDVQSGRLPHCVLSAYVGASVREHYHIVLSRTLGN